MPSISFSSLFCNGLTLRSDSSVFYSRPLCLSPSYTNISSRHPWFTLNPTSYSKVDHCLFYISISIITLWLIMYWVIVLNYLGIESIMDNELCNIKYLCRDLVNFLMLNYLSILMYSNAEYFFVLQSKFKIFIRSLFICIINNWAFSLYIIIIVLFRLYVYFNFDCFVMATSNTDISILLTNGETDNISEAVASSSGSGTSSSGGGTSSSGGGNYPSGPDNPQPSNSSSSINSIESNRNSNSESNTNEGYESDDSSRTMTQETYAQEVQERISQEEQLYDDTVELISAYAQDYLQAYKNLSNQEKQEVEQLVREFVNNLSDMIEEEE